MFYRVFKAARWCMWDELKINVCAHVHGNEGRCHPVKQCDSLMGFLNSFWTTMEVCGTKESSISGFDNSQLIVGFGSFNGICYLISCIQLHGIVYGCRNMFTKRLINQLCLEFTENN